MSTTATFTAAGTGSLQLEYLSSHQMASQPSSWWQGVLGVVGFDKPPNIDRARIPVTASMVRLLRAGDLCEVWRVARPRLFRGSEHGNITPPHSDILRFCSPFFSARAPDLATEGERMHHAAHCAHHD